MLKKYSNIIFAGLVLIIFLLISKNWFSLSILSSNDWPYLYPQVVNELMPLSSWDILFNNGFGQSSLSRLWFDSYALTVVKLASFLSWPIFERVVWFFPAFLMSFFGAFFLSKKIFSSFKFNLISGLIYSANTYFLMIVSGGQVGVMFAYAFLPLAFITFFDLLEKLLMRKSLIFALALAVLCILDLRVGYMFLASEVLIVLAQLLNDRRNLAKKALYFFILPAVVVVVLHMFWILPVILSRQSPTSQLGEIYTSASSLNFFSFAKLENTIGLLHPNWPENIFGKVSFLRPEFLIVAIFAFLSLLFVNTEAKNRRMQILTVILLAIFGIFLAKGTNDPFGQVYTFLFTFIPGFVMFRDPTKWYMIIAIAFSILIPYTLYKLSEKYERSLPIIIPFIFVVFWAFLIRDSFTGIVKGTLSPRQIPANYKELANFLASDADYSRTLWIPTYPTFAYVSYAHPAVPAREFFSATSGADLINKLDSKNAESLLAKSAVKYVIVPEDIFGKIFLTDRKYDEKVYQKTLDDIGRLEYLEKTRDFGKVKVYELKNPNRHFWIDNANSIVKVEYSNPTEYEVLVEKPEGRLIFAESYDKNWIALSAKGETITSKPYRVGYKTFNSFKLNSNGGDNAYFVKYRPQNWVYMGLSVSVVGLVIVIVAIFKTRKK